MIRPDPAETWDLVAKFSGGKEILSACQFISLARNPVPAQ